MHAGKEKRVGLQWLQVHHVPDPSLFDGKHWTKQFLGLCSNPLGHYAGLQVGCHHDRSCSGPNAGKGHSGTGVSIPK